MKTIIFMCEGESIATGDFADGLISAGFQLFVCQYSPHKPFVRFDMDGMEVALLVYPQTLAHDAKMNPNLDAVVFMRELQASGIKTFEASYWFDDFFREWRLPHSEQAAVLRVLEIQK
jgi:hypothetical protein